MLLFNEFGTPKIKDLDLVDVIRGVGHHRHRYCSYYLPPKFFSDASVYCTEWWSTWMSWSPIWLNDDDDGDDGEFNLALRRPCGHTGMSISSSKRLPPGRLQPINITWNYNVVMVVPPLFLGIAFWLNVWLVLDLGIESRDVFSCRLIEYF